MRHLNKKVILDRKASARGALLAGLAESLILYEKIRTTKGKAKALRPFVERIITRAKENTLAARRDIISRLFTKNVAKKLMEQIGPRYAERHGGYTRITALKSRVGDSAEEVIIELV